MKTHPALVLVCLLGALSTTRSAEPRAGDVSMEEGTVESDGEISVFARNGGWCWFQDPRAVIQNGKLVVGSVSGSGSSRGDVRVSVYDLSAEKDLGTYALHAKLEGDDHNAPAFYVRPDGRILAVYAYHTSPAHYYRISEPEDPIRWGPEQSFEHPHGISYMNLYYDAADDTLYNFYRDTRGTYCPAYLISKDHGSTWQPGEQLIFHGAEGRHRPYPRYWSDGEYIHVSFTEAHPQEYRDPGCSIYYAKFKGGKFHRADGLPIKDIRKDGPLLPTEAETVFKGDAQHNAWTSSIVADAEGRVYVAYSVNRSASDHRFHYAVWDGARWSNHEVAYAGPGLYPRAYDYTGLITIGPSNPASVYFSTNVDPTHGTCNPSGKHEMYEAATSDLGKTWKFAPLTQDSPATNMRPVCVVGKEHVAVLWMQGRYSTYTDYDTDIVGFTRRR